jgi:hypothetical protein
MGGNYRKKPWEETIGGNRRRKPWEETIEETMGGNYRGNHGRKP